MIGLVTASTAAAHDTDLPPLVEAFEIVARPVVVVEWDDRGVDWGSFDAAFLRSTWDYAGRYAEFLGWLDLVSESTRLWNPVEAVRWNLDKRYLAELAGAGVPVVATTFVGPLDPVPDLDDAADVVVKPTVGAGSKGARRLAGHEAGAHVADLHRDGFTAMVQPYLPRIDDVGETALVYVGSAAGDGTELRFSHAFGKGAILGGGRPAETDDGGIAIEDIGPRTATDAERRVAETVLASEPVRRLGPLAYARVDLVPTANGPVLLELELVEPSFYFASDPGSAGRAARAWATLV